MQTRKKEEAAKLVKRAAFIAREVMRFWAKARQVVQYKVQQQVDLVKKSRMDKELEFLVGQSEKCAPFVPSRSVIRKS